jgi:uncharacterized membrane protein YdjX (TVP38/TMEM64 family)
VSSLGSAEAPATTRSGHRSRIVALLASVTITALVWVFRDQLVQLERYGYLGVFLVSILSNATVVLPAPGLAVVFAGGSVLNPLLVGLVAGIGEPIGELTGYMAGYAGSAVIEDHARFQQIASLLERHGFLTLFLLSLIPNPVFDLAGIAAGMARIPIGRFLLPCWLGKTGKAILVALLGSVSLEWFLGIMG